MTPSLICFVANPFVTPQGIDHILQVSERPSKACWNMPCPSGRLLAPVSVERLNKEAKEEEESKSEKREVGGERERVETKRIRLSTSFQVLCPVAEVASVGNSFGSLVCVLVVPLSVLVVTVLFSNVNVVCEVVFSGSDCEFVEPQTFSRKKTRSQCGFGV